MSPRLSAAEWRAHQEAQAAEFNARLNALGTGLSPAQRHELLKSAGEQRARGESLIRSDMEAGLGDLHTQLHAVRQATDELVDPEQFKARVAAALAAGDLTGVGPVAALQNGADRGLFDNVWRFNEDWRPLARPIDTLRNAPLGGVVRAMAENVGVRPSAAQKAERIAGATLAGTAGSMTALAALSALSGSGEGVTVYNA